MGISSDNRKRAARLQQLVDSSTFQQKVVIDISTKLDNMNTKYRPTIDALLRANNMASVEDLIAHAARQMPTPQDQAVFMTGFDPTYLICGLLMAPEGATLAAPQAIALAHLGVRMITIKNMSDFFKAAQLGSGAAAEVASRITAEANEAEQTLEKVGGVGGAGEEATRAATTMARIGAFFKALSVIGLVVNFIMGAIEHAREEEQKEKLIAAIHGLQPTRLMTLYIREEGENVLNNFSSWALDLYFSMMPGADDPLPKGATMEAQRIIERIEDANKDIDWGTLEDDLEAADRSSSQFYGGDDLSRDQVIAAAQAKNFTVPSTEH